MYVADVSVLSQEMLRDESDVITALALESISLMCNADALDFYKAWPVVYQSLPCPPDDRPPVMEQWVALLTYGQLDAKAYPEKAAALIQLLWTAAKDPSSAVRPLAWLWHWHIVCHWKHINAYIVERIIVVSAPEHHQSALENWFRISCCIHALQLWGHIHIHGAAKLALIVNILRW